MKLSAKIEALSGTRAMEDARRACADAIDLSAETGLEHGVRLYACAACGVASVVVAPLAVVERPRLRCPGCGKRAKSATALQRPWQSYLREHEAHAARARGAPWN